MKQTKLHLKHLGDGIYDGDDDDGDDGDGDDDYIGLYQCSCKTKTGSNFTTSFYLPEMLTPPRDVNIRVRNALARVFIYRKLV